MKKNRKIQKEFISPGIHNRYYIARGNIVKALRESTRYAKGKIIDIGCGLKPYKEIFLANKNVTEYIGVDYPPANETHYKGETDADIFCDCLHTPFNTETFDTGISTQVLEHVADTEGFFTETFRILKKNAYFILTIPFVWETHAEPYDFYRFTRYGLEYRAREAGFKVIGVKPLEGVFQVLSQMFIENVSFKNRILNKIKFHTYPIINFIAPKLDRQIRNSSHDFCLTYLVILKKE